MRNFQSMRHAAGLSILLAAAATCGACQSGHDFRSAAGASALEPDELRQVLADLARSHDQKIQLAWWVNAPLIGKPVEEPFKAFYAQMGDQQAALLKQLQSWAKDHKVDLTYAYPNGINGEAQKIDEARQEKLVRADSQADFERDNLMQMYDDYESQISKVQALLPKVTDPALHEYLQASLKIHEAGSAEIMALLKRFKFAQ